MEVQYEQLDNFFKNIFMYGKVSTTIYGNVYNLLYHMYSSRMKIYNRDSVSIVILKIVSSRMRIVYSRTMNPFIPMNSIYRNNTLSDIDIICQHPHSDWRMFSPRNKILQDTLVKSLTRLLKSITKNSPQPITSHMVHIAISC